MRVLTSIAILLVLPMLSFGQLEPEKELVNGSSDKITTDGYLYSHYLLEDSNEGFYWIGTSSNTNVSHPFLPEVYNDFQYIYFIKYDENGKAISSNQLTGTTNFQAAYPYAGGITIFGESLVDVESEEQVLPIEDAGKRSFLIRYNLESALDNLVPVWDMTGNQYLMALNTAQDPTDGSLYISGASSEPIFIHGEGNIGEGMGTFFFVLKYDRNLGYAGAFTAGFSEVSGGYFSNTVLIPDGNGGTWLAGLYQGESTPLIGDEVLPASPSVYGTFLLNLGPDMKKEWLQSGTLENDSYYGSSGIVEGSALPDGSVVLVGSTSTGRFTLGDIDLDFPGGQYYSNHFVARLDAGGGLRWVNPVEAMYEDYEGKGASPERPHSSQSDNFNSYWSMDAKVWKNRILYMTGLFHNDALEIAGRTLEKPMYEGNFVLAMDLSEGQEMWGFALSSDYIELSGFDVDGSGNPAVLAYGSREKYFEQNGPDSAATSSFSTPFIFGLDHQGKFLWNNNTYLTDATYGLTGYDLELLERGQVFASMRQNTPGKLNVGGSELNSTANNTLHLLNLEASNTLGGIVQREDGTPVFPAWVKIYKTTPMGAYPMADSVPVDEMGRYSLTRMYPGDYTLLAEPDPQYNSDLMPTYVGGGKGWDEAKYHLLETNTRFTSLYITLAAKPELNPADGSGQVGGNVSYDDSPVYKGTLGKPVRRTAVLLKRKSQVQEKGTLEDDEMVAYVITDDEGNYSVENVPDGEYYLHVDIPGLPMENTYEITIVGSQIVEGMDFLVDDIGISITGSVDVQQSTYSGLKLFPNPGNGQVWLELPEEGDFTLDVYDAAGGLRMQLLLEGAVGEELLDLSGLAPGLYFMHLKGSGTATLRYMRE